MRPGGRRLGRQLQGFGVQPSHDRRRFRLRRIAGFGAIGLADDRQDFSHLNRFARRHRQSQNGAGARRRNLHHGFVGFHLDQWLIGPHLVALRHQPAHDLTLGNAFSHVREAEFQGHAFTSITFSIPNEPTHLPKASFRA